MSSSYNLQATVATPMKDGRLAVRTRPRRLMFLLFAAALATIILFSRHSLLTEPMGATLGLNSPSSPQNTAVEPVVFALIMFSESSAMEGAILLKVKLFLSTLSCVWLTTVVRDNVRVTTRPFPYPMRQRSHRLFGTSLPPSDASSSSDHSTLLPTDATEHVGSNCPRRLTFHCSRCWSS